MEENEKIRNLLYDSLDRQFEKLKDVNKSIKELEKELPVGGFQKE